MKALIILVSIILFLLVIALVGGIIWFYRYYQFVRSAFDDFSKRQKGHEEDLSVKFSDLNEKIKALSERQDENAAKTAKEISEVRSEQANLFSQGKTILTENMESLSQKHVSAVTAINTKFDEAATQRKEIAADATEKLNLFKTEQAKCQEKNTAAFAAADKKVSDILDELASTQKIVGDVQTALLAAFQQTSETMDGELETLHAGLTGIRNKLDFLSDRGSVLSDYLAAFRQESANSLKQLLTVSNTNGQCLEKMFAFLNVNINSILDNVKLLQGKLSSVACSQAQNESKHVQLNQELQQNIEMRFASVVSTLQLIKSSLHQSPCQEENGGTSDYGYEYGMEIQESDFSSDSSVTGPHSIYAPNGDEIRFTPQSDGKTISETYRKGKRIFEILHSEMGTPEKGTMYSENGDVVKTFEYDLNGQVKN